MNALTAIFCCSLLSLATAQSASPDPAPPKADPQLHFEPMPGTNAGYMARGAGGRIIADGMSLSVELSGGTARMELVGGAAGSILPEAPAGAVSNYFVGQDQSQWRQAVPRYRRLRVTGALPGVDLVYYGAQNKLEFDFVLDPRIDVDQIRMRWSGVDKLWVDDAGRLHLGLPKGSAHLEPPRVYAAGSSDQILPSRYRMLGDSEVGFLVEGRDSDQTLVIDPILIFGTQLGGSGWDEPAAVDVDAAGNMVVVGETVSADFPLLNPIQDTHSGLASFVTKYDAAGNMVYSTYLLNSSAAATRFDSFGNAYVTGIATGNAFPTSQGAVQPVHQGAGDIFCSKIGAGGALLWSTFLGGFSRDWANDLEVGVADHVYILGQSRGGFPLTPNGYNIQSSGMIVVSFDRFGNLGNSTNLGFSGAASDMAIDALGQVYVTGGADGGVPTNVNSYIVSNVDGARGFVMVLQNTLDSLILATYLEEAPTAITVHREVGGILAIPTVFGLTNSSTFPWTGSLVTPHPGQTVFGYVAQLSDGLGSLRFAVQLPFLSPIPSGGGIDQDAAGNLYISGSNCPSVPPPLFNAYWGPRADNHPNGWLAKLDPQATQILYATYVGDREVDQGHIFQNSIRGMAVSDDGEAVVVGTSEGFFETTPGAPQSLRQGDQPDAFLARFSADSMQEYGLSSQIEPPILSGAGDLTLGGSLHLRLRDCDPMVPGVLFVGSSRTNLPATFLVGNPILLVNAPRSIPFVTSLSGTNYGSWDFDRSLIGATALVGMQFNVQAVVLDSTFTEVRSSRALEFTIQ